MSELTPFEFAGLWYRPSVIHKGIQEAGGSGFGSWCRVPEDTNSLAFAEWLTEQYRLAMAKGIVIGEQRQKDRTESEADG